MSEKGYVGRTRDTTDHTLAGQRRTARGRNASRPPDVPEGTRADVLAWVGHDPERARQALEAERAGKARSTLIDQLEALAG